MNEKIERDGLKLELESVQSPEWIITVKGDINDADYITNTLLYSPNEFQREGLALALLLNRVVGINMLNADIPWAYEIFSIRYESVLFPYIENCEVHTIVKFTVKYRECDKIYSFDPSTVELEEANKIIKKYLVEVLDFSEKQAEAVLNNDWIADDEEDDEDCVDISSYYVDYDNDPGFIHGFD